MTKKSRRILHKGIDYVSPMPDNDRAASTSGRQAPQTETGIIFRTRPCRVLTGRVRNRGGGGGGRAPRSGDGRAAFFAFLPGVMSMLVFLAIEDIADECEWLNLASTDAYMSGASRVGEWLLEAFFEC